MRLEQVISLQAVAKLKLTSVTRHGLPIKIEHPKGTIRELKDDSGNTVYKKFMHHDYGFISKTIGRDGDEVDAIVGPDKNAKEVYIIHMVDLGPVKDEREDEDKCMIGFPTADAAKMAFESMYPKSFYGGMSALPVKVFKTKLKNASLPYHKRKIHAAVHGRCPRCGSNARLLMAPDFETSKCQNCGLNYQVKTGKVPRNK